MTKLLFLTERYHPDIGGVARSAQRTAETLAGMDVEIHVLAWTKTIPPGVLESDSLGPNLTVHHLGLFANWDLSMQHTMNVLEWMHDREQFDGVWGHYLYPAGFVTVLFGQTHGIPTTVSARGNDVDRLTFPPGDFARLTWTLERADQVTAVSHDLAKKIQVLVPREAPAHVIHNSVNSDVFQPVDGAESLRHSLGIGPPERVLGFSGELRHKKGMPFVIRALEEVRRHMPACLLIIGEVRSKDQLQLTEYLAEHEGADARVIITGHIDDPREVSRHLNICDVFLQPSVWDGLPNAVLEAMSCGRIVIGSDAGGIPEVLDHGRNGFMLPKNQLHRLGEACLEILNAPDSQTDAIRQTARETIVNRFHPAGEADALRSFLTTFLPNCSS